MLSMLLVAFHLKSYSCDCAELLISLPGSIKAGLQCETDDRVLGRYVRRMKMNLSVFKEAAQ